MTQNYFHRFNSATVRFSRHMLGFCWGKNIFQIIDKKLIEWFFDLGPILRWKYEPSEIFWTCTLYRQLGLPMDLLARTAFGSSSDFCSI